ncbi:hypothetical protein EKH55_1165 [Sinorhizobium alkalisoli]|nr:hypothetical protein EKH55_1165 [Sinorhizobium alkalisoli]
MRQSANSRLQEMLDPMSEWQSLVRPRRMDRQFISAFR